MFWRKWIKSDQGNISLLGKDTKLVGDICFSGTLRIEGKVYGSVKGDGQSTANLMLNHQARVQGPVRVDNIKIGGFLNGNVHASQRVEVLPSGCLDGNVYTTDFVIQKGGQFKGTCYKYSNIKKPLFTKNKVLRPKSSVRKLS